MIRTFLLAATAAFAAATPALGQEASLPAWTLAPRTAASVPLSTVVLGEAPALRHAPKANAVDLRKLGYVEEEYFLTTPAYTTRILLRRPVSVATFSGTVEVEPLPDGSEWPTVWTAAWPHIVRQGDVWVGVTVSPGNVESLFMTADAGRYSQLKVPGGSARAEILARVGLLLRSSDGPLAKAGLQAQAGKLKGLLQIFGVGWGPSACMQAEFINQGFHARVRRADGRPVFTGYLVGGCIGGGRIEIPGDAPVIAMASESDYLPPRVKQTLAARFADGNKPGENRSRWYDIAGAASASWLDQPQLAISLYQAEAPAAPACGQPVSPLPGRDDFLRGALFALNLWTRMGIPPTPGATLELNGDGSVKRDGDGNALGGLRPHWVAAAVSTFVAGNQGAGFCAESGSEKALPPGRVAERYPTREAYLAKVAAHLDQLVMDHALVYDDAKAELERAKAQNLP